MRYAKRSYQKKDGHVCPSFVWYDTDSDYICMRDPFCMKRLYGILHTAILYNFIIMYDMHRTEVHIVHVVTKKK